MVSLFTVNNKCFAETAEHNTQKYKNTTNKKVRQAEADMVVRSLQILQYHSKTTSASLQGSEGDQSPHVQDPLIHINSLQTQFTRDNVKEGM